jgi:hypothetical protein
MLPEPRGSIRVLGGFLLNSLKSISQRDGVPMLWNDSDKRGHHLILQGDSSCGLALVR